MDVTRLRQQIPACQRMVYVNTGWSGPSPVSVTGAVKERLDYEMEQGPTSPEVYESGLAIHAGTREAVARLLNASEEEVCLTENTTQGLNIVLNGLSWRHGDEIITCDLEHSSVFVPSYFLQRRLGVTVNMLPIAPNASGESILEDLESAVTDRTRLIFLSHIQYSCGLRMPVKEICRMAKGRDILTLLDGAQAAGHIPLDVSDIGCDFYAIPGHKWLLGLEGTGALYIRKELIPLVEPVVVSSKAVRSHEDPYSFEPLTDSMDKFLTTTTSTALQAGMAEAIRFIQDIGVGQIESSNLYLASYLKDALNRTPGIKVLSTLDAQCSSGLVSLAIEGVDPKYAVSRFWDQHRVVARSVPYPPCVRVSLHFFNTEAEVDRVVEALRGLA